MKSEVKWTYAWSKNNFLVYLGKSYLPLLGRKLSFYDHGR